MDILDIDSPWAENADHTIAQQNEWSKITYSFTNAGYREGITAGKESALQEGFDVGFALVGAPLGRELGILRGMVTALISYLSSPSSSPSRLQLLSEARDIAAQLSYIRFSDIAPPDLEAEAHAKEHLGGEGDVEVDMPEELAEKRKLETLEDMLGGLHTSGGGAAPARPTINDVQILKDKLYALSSSIGLNLASVSLPNME